MAKIRSETLVGSGVHAVDPSIRRHRETIGRVVAKIKILESREVTTTVLDDETGKAKKVTRVVPVRLADRKAGETYIVSGSTARKMVKAGVAEIVKGPCSWPEFDGRDVMGNPVSGGTNRAMQGAGESTKKGKKG